MYVISKIVVVNELEESTDVFVVHNRRTGREYGRYANYLEAAARLRELAFS
jgi:hypothetical protein